MCFEFPSPSQYPQLLHLWKDAFGEYGGFWEMFLETAFLPDHCRCIREHSQVTAALYWFDCSCQGEKLAYIYAVVTHPEHRGRGLCRSLLADVHKLLSETGYSAAMLVPESEPLRQMYRKLGYRDCTTVSEFSCAAGSTPVPLRAVGPGEYARLRRNFLPAGGAVQEGTNLLFLEQQAQFYTGADFLMAAWQENGILHAMELLGNRQAAAGIVHSLDCTLGHFRTPGQEKPFAMFHALTEHAARPSYFGFAFD